MMRWKGRALALPKATGAKRHTISHARLTVALGALPCRRSRRAGRKAMRSGDLKPLYDRGGTFDLAGAHQPCHAVPPRGSRLQP